MKWHKICNYIRYDYTLGFSHLIIGKAQEYKKLIL